MVRAFNRPKVPKPKQFGRDSKVVKNFLFDLEQYYEATNIEDDATMVTTTTKYLMGDIKICWCVGKVKISARDLVIAT